MNWIQTYTGKKFDPLHPDPAAICIEDIAHALSMICRYNGHCKYFYSVAEHSILVSENVDPENAFRGLMHDASEAYISDLTRPVKDHIFDYRQIEGVLSQACRIAFGIDYNGSADRNVKDIDTRILMDEKKQVMIHDIDWRWSTKPIGVKIDFLSPVEAEVKFLNRFYELRG